MATTSFRPNRQATPNLVKASQWISGSVLTRPVTSLQCGSGKGKAVSSNWILNQDMVGVQLMLLTAPSHTAFSPAVWPKIRVAPCQNWAGVQAVRTRGAGKRMLSLLVPSGHEKWIQISFYSNQTKQNFFSHWVFGYSFPKISKDF